ALRRQTPEDELPRRRWVYSLVSQWYDTGHFAALYDDLRRHPEKFVAFTWLSIPTYDKLLEALHSGLTYQDTQLWRCISPAERLLVNLRFLTTGNTFASLHFKFLLGHSTINAIVLSTCDVIWNRLKGTVIPPPIRERWLEISSGFEANADFPNCVWGTGW
ncbi:DDE superfamily endonuclease, partial [Pristimantis euphronides]